MADVPHNLQEQINYLESIFIIDQSKLKQITDHFVSELAQGLTTEGGDIPMNVTWCMGFPTGYETGTYLALDMGGTNLRVCEITLPEEKGEFDIIQSKYRMPEELKLGDGDELWEYIADCLQQFIEYHHEGENLDKLPLGFTFSYPVTQDYVDNGVLQRWTKGFDIKGVEGKDVAPPFEKALAERVWPTRMNGETNVIAKHLQGRTHQAHCIDQRHYRHSHRFIIHRRPDEDRLHLWDGLQRRIYGALRRHPQACPV